MANNMAKQTTKEMNSQNRKGENILVIGAGVVGLTTAICIKKAGYNVKIVAESNASTLTSNVAGALWEWPPAVCGAHGAPRSIKRSKEWCMTSYDKFKEMSAELNAEDTGIYLRDVYFYFKYPIESREKDLEKMQEIAENVDGFARGLDIVKPTIDLNFQGGIKDAYKHMAPMVNTDVYMKWLFNQAMEMGCEFVQEKIPGNVVINEAELRQKYTADAIINCTGLGSIDSAGDNTMFPLRGSLVRVEDKEGLIEDAHCISHDDSTTDEQDIIFIVPRGKNNIVVLGGLTQQNQWSTDMSLDMPIIKQMRDGCLSFLKELQQLPIDTSEPVRSGVRPLTQQNVIVERVPDTNIIHNYGHGGSGVTLSWGCAEEIVALLDGMMQEDKASPFSAVTNLNADNQTVFILHDKQPVNFDLEKIKTTDRNIVFLCSREGLAQLTPSQYTHLDLLKVVDNFNVDGLSQSIESIASAANLTVENSRIITNDDYSTLLAATLRERLKMQGDKPELMQPFINKSALRMKLENSNIKLSKSALFDPNQYMESKDSYLDSLNSELGTQLIVAPITGADCERMQKINAFAALQTWCEANKNTTEQFEFSEVVEGQRFNTSVVVENGEMIYFAASEQFRPSSEFLSGHSIGMVVVPEENSDFHMLKAYTSSVLDSLNNDYPQNGVLNLEFVIKQGSKEKVLMDISAKPPEGQAAKMVEIHQGVNLQTAHQTLQLGLAADLKVKSQADRKYSAFVSYPRAAGTVTSLEKPVFESELNITWHVGMEQTLQASKNTREAAISFTMEHASYAQLVADFEAANVASFYSVS